MRIQQPTEVPAAEVLVLRHLLEHRSRELAVRDLTLGAEDLAIGIVKHDSHDGVGTQLPTSLVVTASPRVADVPGLTAEATADEHAGGASALGLRHHVDDGAAQPVRSTEGEALGVERIHVGVAFSEGEDVGCYTLVAGVLREEVDCLAGFDALAEALHVLSVAGGIGIGLS